MDEIYRKVNILTDNFMLRHDTGGHDHPEQSARLAAIMERLERSPFPSSILSVRKAEPEHILKVHKQTYAMRFEEACLSGKSYLGHSDNRISYETYEAALHSVGACLDGIDLLEQDRTGAVMCINRPPGHHAEASLALGFCFFNNVAIAARYWQDFHGIERIFILDFDAHHGNGIQEIFDEEPTVFYASIHEHPTFSFPGTGWGNDNGTGNGVGYTLNLPVSPGATDAQILKIMEENVAPALKYFKPQAIIAACGFDGHALDDMSGLCYTTALYAKFGMYLSAWAEKYCNGRLLNVLEGGYHLEALAASVEAYLKGVAVKGER